MSSSKADRGESPLGPKAAAVWERLSQTMPDAARTAEVEQLVTEIDKEPRSGELTVHTGSIPRADSLNVPNAPAAGAEGAFWGLERIPVGSALLVVTRGRNTGSRFVLNRSVTSAGRHPDSDIFLDDITVSRWHAEFRLEKGEFEVVDVGSLNGTYVNGEFVDSAMLANGDEVQIGRFRLLYLTGPTTDGQSGSCGSERLAPVRRPQLQGRSLPAAESTTTKGPE